MYESYLTNGKQLSFDKAQVMAIINLTPDSFYDGGKFSSVTDVLKDAEMKINEGATILDLGAVSSRPDAEEVSCEEEIKRLKQPLRELRAHFPHAFISVDTYRAEVADFAIASGADIINDISGGNMDVDMLPLIAKNQVVYILMHMQGTPQNMQQHPHYENVVNDVEAFFKKKISVCEQLGIDKLILDAGFGFGKSVEHNYLLLKNLHKIVDLGYPVLSGISRKSMINKIIHTSPVTALTGTTVLNAIALNNGSKIIRVHDVKEARQAIDIMEYYKQV
ncbi:MAG: dihydropteroate synthase [Bacteroidota bacterium]